MEFIILNASGLFLDSLSKMWLIIFSTLRSVEISLDGRR